MMNAAVDVLLVDVEGGEQQPRPQQLPSDLPRTLDDRRHAPKEEYVRETEMYDGWQGGSTTCKRGTLKC